MTHHKNTSPATQLINLFFSQFNKSGRLTGSPQYKRFSNGKVEILMPYYSPASDLVVSSQKMKTLGAALSQVIHQPRMIISGTEIIKRRGTLNMPFPFAPVPGGDALRALPRGSGSPVASDLDREIKKVEVRVIKLRYPYLDGTILAKFVAFNAEKYAFARIHKSVFKKRAFFQLPRASGDALAPSLGATVGLLPSENSKFSDFNSSLPCTSKGLKLELAGRLTTQQSIPRKTVANKHIGSAFSAPLKG